MGAFSYILVRNGRSSSLLFPFVKTDVLELPKWVNILKLHSASSLFVRAHFFSFLHLRKAEQKFVLTKFHCASVFQKGNPENWYVKSYAHTCHTDLIAFISSLFSHLPLPEEKAGAIVYSPGIFGFYFFFTFFGFLYLLSRTISAKEKRKKMDTHVIYLDFPSSLVLLETKGLAS